MRIVIDTNIVFSIFLSNKSRFRDIFFDNENIFYAPSKMLIELFSHFDKIHKYSKLNQSDFLMLIYEVITKINFIEENSIPNKIYLTAIDLCKDYDITDTPFVALSIYYNAKYWTGDKIKDYLKEKGFKNIFEY